MTDSGELTRRTLLGATAAAGLASLSTGASGQGAKTAQATPQTEHLAEYANRVGRVTTDKLDEAFDDWGDGEITNDELDAIIDAWSEGERVTDEGIDVIPLDSDIDEDIVLEREPDQITPGNQVVYQVQTDIDVDAELEIEAGVAIEFEQGTEFDVGNGTLVGNGTENEPILMTGTNPTRGWWDGIRVRTTDLDNELNHTIIEYAGGRDGCLELANRFGSDEALITLTDCTFRRSGRYGLYLSSGGGLASDSEDNTYTTNRAGAAYARTNNMQTLSGSSTFQGNDNDFVRVNGRSIDGDGADSTQITWDALDVPYRMSDDRHDIDDLTLEIEPGATFEFTQDSYPRLRNGLRIIAKGTADEPILFTGTDTQRGWWDGIEFETSDSENVFEYVTVEYAGDDLPGNVTFADRLSGHSGYLEMSHCTFRQSAGYGIYLDDDVEIVDTQNTYTENEAGAAYVQTESMHMLSDSSTFQGNDGDYVVVEPQSIDGAGAEETTLTWDAIDVPYRMSEDRHDIDNVELVIDPGATFEFTESCRMRVRSGTQINWVGMEENGNREDEHDLVDEIIFTGVESERGWWDGLEIETPRSDNVMRHVIVEYAGNDLPANVTLADRLSGHEVDLRLEECTFRHSGGFGLYADSGVELDTFSNTYTGNEAGPASIRTENMHMLSRFSEFEGNDNDYVLVRDATLDDRWGSEVTWEALDVPYRMDGGRHDVDDLTLNVSGGATFEFTEGARIRLRNDCSVVMEGEEEFPITFTGTDDQAGWWDGIEFETDSLLNSMEYVIVEDGGDDLPGNITFADRLSRHTAYLEMSNCTIRNSGEYGLYLDNGVELVLSGNTYTDNTDEPVNLRAENAHELSGDSSFTGNGEDTIRVRGTSIDESDEPPGEDAIVWDALDVPYRLTGSVDVDGTTFSAEPGAEVHAEEDIEFEFDDGCVIDLEGTEENPIVFRAESVGQDIQGWWRGIRVDSESVLSEMEYVVVENGGRDPDSTPEGNVHITSDAALEMTNSELNQSGGAGVYVDSGATVNDDICEANDFADNQGGDCIVE